MKDAIKMMESQMSEESVRRAKIKAEQEIMTIRLAQLREEMNKNNLKWQILHNHLFLKSKKGKI